MKINELIVLDWALQNNCKVLGHSKDEIAFSYTTTNSYFVLLIDEDRLLYPRVADELFVCFNRRKEGPVFEIQNFSKQIQNL